MGRGGKLEGQEGKRGVKAEATDSCATSPLPECSDNCHRNSIECPTSTLTHHGSTHTYLHPHHPHTHPGEFQQEKQLLDGDYAIYPCHAARLTSHPQTTNSTH